MLEIEEKTKLVKELEKKKSYMASLGQKNKASRLTSKSKSNSIIIKIVKSNRYRRKKG